MHCHGSFPWTGPYDTTCWVCQAFGSAPQWVVCHILYPNTWPNPSFHQSHLQRSPTDVTFLPQNMEDLPHHNPHPIAQMRLSVELSLPSLHAALKSLSSRTRLVALVLDLFSIALDVAKQLNLLCYTFSFSGAASLSFHLCFPEFDDSVSSKFLDLTQTMNVPGCDVPFQVKDLPDLIHFPRSSEVYRAHLSACQI